MPLPQPNALSRTHDAARRTDRQSKDAWPQPRRQSELRLRLRWRSDALASFPSLPYPIDVQFSKEGLAIYDYGERRVHIVDAASGRQRLVQGRRGPGPAEFGDRPVAFFGRRSQIFTVEFSDGRVNTLQEGRLQSVHVSKEGRWSTGCAWGANAALLQTSGHDTHDYFVTTLGDDARITDSVAAPWSRYSTLPFIVRQGQLRQANDSTCALLPLYQQEFALIAPNTQPRRGMHVEALPEAKAIERRTASMRSSSLAKGAKSGALDARTWRHLLLILFEGTSDDRRRILDVYDLRTLAYRGSTRFPFDVSRLAVSGDTLAVIAEVDDEPIVATFLVSANERPQRTR